MEKMKVRVLVPFNAFGYLQNRDEEFEMDNKGEYLDLVKLGWVTPSEPEKFEVSRDMSVSETKNVEKTRKSKKSE
jgi:hypothetical protein